MAPHETGMISIHKGSKVFRVIREVPAFFMESFDATKVYVFRKQGYLERCALIFWQAFLLALQTGCAWPRWVHPGPQVVHQRSNIRGV